MRKPKAILIVRIKTFENNLLPHKPCLKYRITVGTNILLLPGLNLCTKDPYLTIGTGLIRFQRINEFPEKSIHLETLKIAIIQKPTRITKPFMTKP